MTELLTRTQSPAMRDMLDVYRRHSPVTDPGPHADVLRDLPRDIPTLVEMIGGVFAHYETDIEESDFVPSAQRLTDVDARSVLAMLDRIFALDPAPLTIARPISRRYLGVCRDACLLLLAILRTHGVPARLRYGTANHLYVPGRPMHDHVVVEYWSAEQSCWKYGDARMYEAVRTRCNLPDRYRDDVPAEVFLTGAQAWRRSQESDRAALRMSGLMFNADAGRWQARNLFMYDLASLYGWEPLMWDAWGYIKRATMRARPRGPLQHLKLNRLASFDDRDPAQWRQLMREYRLMRLVRLTGRVLECSPVNGRRRVAGIPSWRVEHARD